VKQSRVQQQTVQVEGCLLLLTAKLQKEKSKVLDITNELD
jgi:hypothetical protein